MTFFNPKDVVLDLTRKTGKCLGFVFVSSVSSSRCFDVFDISCFLQYINKALGLGSASASLVYILIEGEPGSCAVVIDFLWPK